MIVTSWEKGLPLTSSGQISNMLLNILQYRLQKLAIRSRILAWRSHGQRSLAIRVHGVAKSRTRLSVKHAHTFPQKKITVEKLLRLRNSRC